MVMPNPLNKIIDTLTGRIVDPFPTFKFHVEVASIVEAAFTECSGLEMSTDIYEYREGGLNDFIHKFPGCTKMSNIILKRGFAISNELFNWYKRMEMDINDTAGKGFDFPQVTIILNSSAELGKKVRWSLNRAFPIKWVGPTFKADEAMVAIETLEIAHHGITVDIETFQMKTVVEAAKRGARETVATHTQAVQRITQP